MQQTANTAKEKLNACMQINKRLNPAKQEQNLNALCYIGDEVQQELLQRLDFSLKVLDDPQSKKQFVGCEFNRDGDSYRSPHNNTYFPALASSELYPSKYLRELEVKANVLFEEYRRHYYDGGLTSTYVWNKDQETYGVGVCVVKEAEGLRWNSINVVEVRRSEAKKKMVFKIQTTVFIQLEGAPDMEATMSGSLQRTKEESMEITDDQQKILAKIGSMVEDQETSMRKNLDAVYVTKTQDIIFRTRFLGGKNTQQDALKRELMEMALKNKAK